MSISTKWPRLLVVGEPVTEVQADEILIRTNEWRTPFSNDKNWLATVENIAAEFGRPREPQRTGDHDAYMVELRGHWPQMQAWHDRLGILELGYLRNYRIMSAWIGGPHGWCDWNGAIFCSEFNIGKWPSDREVGEDWEQIASAFPFLDLTAQCVDEEGEADSACAQWRVVNGQVHYCDGPLPRLDGAAELTPEWMAPGRFGLGGERGVSEARLRQAFERVAGR
jgi:hypothetical protein